MRSNADKSKNSLKTILAEMQLPALPQSALRLLELSQDPSNGPAEFAVPIECEPGLASQVLCFVNSSFFGFSQEIASVRQAISLVGIHTVKNFALWNAVFNLLPDPKCGPFHLSGLWQDSLRRGLLTRRLAKLLGLDEAEELFTAALLQDMAIPLLAKAMPQEYAALLEARSSGEVRLSAVEQRVLGWTHAEAAGMLAKQWKLPEQFVTLLTNHHQIDSHMSETDSTSGAMLVSISALLPSVSDSAWHEVGQFQKCYESLRLPGAPELETILGQVDAEFSQLAPLLNISSHGPSLVDRLHGVDAPSATV